MGRKRLPEENRKEMFTIRLPKKLIEKIKAHKAYTVIVEKILKEYFYKNN